MVCREGFASLHGIGTKRVRRVTACVAKVTIPKDKRGMHNNIPSISDDPRNKVDEHIRLFPYCVSHYARHGNSRRNPSSELCIAKNKNKMFTFLTPK